MYILTEKLTSTVAMYMVLKRLLTNWKDWKAYKNGIIDEHGKRIRKPKTAKEREGWDILDRFCWSIKRLVTKYIGDKKFVYLFSAAYLMKEDFSSIVSKNLDKYNKELENLTATKQKKIYDVINEMESLNLISESNLDFHTNLLKIISKTSIIIEKHQLELIFEDEGVGSVGATTLGDIALPMKRIDNGKPFRRTFNPMIIMKRSNILKRRKRKWEKSQETKTQTQSSSK